LTVVDTSTNGVSFIGSALIVVTGSGGSTFNFQVNFTDTAPVFVTVPGDQTVTFPATDNTGPLAVSAASPPGHGVTYSATVGGYSLLGSIQEQFGLIATAPNYLFNSRNLQEKYLVSNNGSNSTNGGYYFIVPNGNLYAWLNGSINQSLAAGAAASP